LLQAPAKKDQARSEHGEVSSHLSSSLVLEEGRQVHKVALVLTKSRLHLSLNRKLISPYLVPGSPPPIRPSHHSRCERMLTLATKPPCHPGPRSSTPLTSTQSFLIKPASIQMQWGRQALRPALIGRPTDLGHRQCTSGERG
jgi:hypothetical protein